MKSLQILLVIFLLYLASNYNNKNINPDDPAVLSDIKIDPDDPVVLSDIKIDPDDPAVSSAGAENLPPLFNHIHGPDSDNAPADVMVFMETVKDGPTHLTGDDLQHKPLTNHCSSWALTH